MLTFIRDEIESNELHNEVDSEMDGRITSRFWRIEANRYLEIVQGLNNAGYASFLYAPGKTPERKIVLAAAPDQKEYPLYEQSIEKLGMLRCEPVKKESRIRSRFYKISDDWQLEILADTVNSFRILYLYHNMDPDSIKEIAKIETQNRDVFNQEILSKYFPQIKEIMEQ